MSKKYNIKKISNKLYSNHKKVLDYNILKRHSNENIQTWKSYPGISEIVRIARNIIEKDDTSNLGELARMMQVHESQQSAIIVATIAILVGNKLNDNIDADYRKAIGDIIMWNVPVIKSKDDWPLRKKYSPKKVFENKAVDDEKRITTLEKDLKEARQEDRMRVKES